MAILLSSCSQLPRERYGSEHCLFDPVVYEDADFRDLKIIWSSEYPLIPCDFVIGDISGNRNKEIFLYSSDNITVFDQKGGRIRQKEFDHQEFDFSEMILYDVDGDGKLNPVSGTKNDKTARLVILNGFLDVIREITDDTIYKSVSKPLGTAGNRIIFTGYSGINIGHKSIIAYDFKRIRQPGKKMFPSFRRDCRRHRMMVL